MMRYEEVKMVRMENIYDYMKKHYDAETAEKVRQWFRVSFDCYHYNCAIYLPVMDWKRIAELLNMEEEAREAQGTKYLFEEFYYERAEEYFYYYLSEVAGIPIDANVMVLL